MFKINRRNLLCVDGAYFSSNKRKTAAALQSLDIEATEEEQLGIKTDTENATKYHDTRDMEELQSSGVEPIYYMHQILI